MTMRTWIPVLALTLGALSGARPGWAGAVPEPILRDILTHEQARNTADHVLADLTKHDGPAVRARAYRALGRIQDLTLLPALRKGLADKSEYVRLEAAFAVGQLHDPLAEPILWNRFEEEKNSEVRVRLLEALGKCGTEKSVEKLAGIVGDGEPAPAGAAAIALGIIARRGFSIEAAAPALDQALAGSVPEVRWRAAFAVFRGKVAGAANGLSRALTAKDPETLIYAARAVGALGRESMGPALLPLLEHEDWRVRVEALRAMCETKQKFYVSRASILLDDPHENVRFVAIEAMGKLDGLIRILHLEDTGDWRLLVAYLKAYAESSKEGALSQMRPAMKNPDWRVRRGVAEAFANIQSEYALLLLEGMTQDESPNVLTAVATTLSQYPQRHAVELLRPLLANNDPGVLATAAEASGTRHDLGAVPALLTAFEKLQSPVDTDVMTTILDALGKTLSATPDDDPIGEVTDEERARALTVLEQGRQDADPKVSEAAALALTMVQGKEVRPATLPEPRVPPQFDQDLAVALETADREPVARITTNRGVIVVRLLGHEAPGTVANFVSLVREGFYNGLTFHRVVADFVTQGGDPRGDGWGGPGYAIRCEYNPLHYERGRVGMALSGKDTGGSQFFITHSPQPHLDGNYTLFGDVLEGMDVVDQILVGDVIQEITLEGI